MQNTTKYAEAEFVRRNILDTAAASGVDLRGLETMAEVRDAIEEQAPELMDLVLDGHGAQDPVMRQWFDDRPDVLRMKAAESDGAE